VYTFFEKSFGLLKNYFDCENKFEMRHVTAMRYGLFIIKIEFIPLLFAQNKIKKKFA
jgi:hypothetical protein